MTRNTWGRVWEFKTARFTVALEMERDYRHKYDGDDENGDIQRALDSGDYVAFDSTVTVELDGEEIARDSLGASVYESGNVAAFYTDHRCADAMNRNCTLMRAACGENCCICHYFPSMVSQAIQEARAHVKRMASVPRLRK